MDDTGNQTTTTAFDLQAGVETNINNPNPANMEVTISTTAGSLVKFTVPAGGTFTVKSNGDLAHIRIETDYRGYGPRSID